MAKELPQADLQNLPACAAEYIKLVIKKMRYRKKVRADVMAELAAHFEDELRDCATDDEKEQKAQQLIESFGDVKLLATLLRRAKKRCRPLWRKALVRSFQALGIIVLYLLICFGRLTIGTPTISVNYVDWLNDMVSGGKAESQNAKPYYDSAGEVCVRMPDWLRKSRIKWPGDFNDIEMQMFSEWLDDNSKAFRLVRKGAEKPYFWPVYIDDDTGLVQDVVLLNTMKNLAFDRQSSVLQNAMKLLSGYKKVALAMKWQISYEAYSGDVKAALNDCMVLQRFGSHLHGKGLLIEQLVGIAVEALGHHMIFMILEKVDVSADTLKNIQEGLENEDSKPKAVIDLEAEKAFWYDLVQRGFTDDGKGGGRVLKPGLPLVIRDWKSSVWEFVSLSYPDRREVTATIDKYFKQAAELLQETPYDIYQKGLSYIWDEIGKKCFMLKMLGPAHGKISELTWILRTGRRGLLTVLAALRYEKDRASYPENLEQLISAGYLKELPVDAYSNEPLVYRRTEEGFTLYSFGADFDDDGGVHSKWGEGKEGGDQVFWPVQK